jgi:hypothetical protein
MMKGRYLVVGAVVVFLLFLGINLPQFLCPLRWSVECGVPDSSGTILMFSGPTVPSEADAKKLAADAAKLGRKCFVNPVRECLWNGYF